MGSLPQFFLESFFYRQSKRGFPTGLFRALLLNLLANTDSPFSSEKDVDGDSNRLVAWPEKDRIVNYEEGTRFFEVSLSGGDFASKSSNTAFESILDCGHVFHSDEKYTWYYQSNGKRLSSQLCTGYTYIH